MSRYKLSIIVPTYNGAAWIEDTLRSVLVQLLSFKEEVQFLVRDNCSTDGTKALIERLNKEFGDIINYNRRDSNSIADVNYREAIGLTDSEYVLLLGDDDLLFPGFIGYTLYIIDKNPDVGLVYYNRISTTRDYNGASLKHQSPSPAFFITYKDTEDFIRDHPSGPDFMSVNVLKRECLDKGFSFSKKEYYGVEWYSVMLYGLKNQKCVSVFCPMVLQRFPVKRVWDDRALLFVVVGMDNLFRDISQIYPSAYQSWLGYADKNVHRMEFIFKSIPLRPSLYDEKWHELSVKLNGGEKAVAWLLLRCRPLTPLLKLLVLYPYKIKNIFGKIKSKLFK